MEETPVEAVEKYLDTSITWPASKEDVIACVERNGAPQELVEELRAEDKDRFVGPNQVHEVWWKAAPDPRPDPSP